MALLSAWCWLIMYSRLGCRAIIYFQGFFPPTQILTVLWFVFPLRLTFPLNQKRKLTGCHGNPEEVITFRMRRVVINMYFAGDAQSLGVRLLSLRQCRRRGTRTYSRKPAGCAHVHSWWSRIMPCGGLVPHRSCESLRFIPTTVSPNCLLNEEKSSLIRSALFLSFSFSLYLGCKCEVCWVCVQKLELKMRIWN